MRLFEPGRIGKMTTKNRVVMTPMGMFGLPNPDGSLNSRGIDFYTERARGGVGLIFPAATLVTTAFEDSFFALNVLDSPDKAIKWSELAEEIHRYEARLGAQLSVGLGRVSVDFYNKPEYVPVSASAVPAFWKPSVTCRSLTIEEIESMVEAFGKAASYAKEAGVDAIEVHGYGGYLLDQFMSSLWNKRSDRYGGDLEGRMRFPVEIISEVRDACGNDFPVIFKFTPVHHTEGGRELVEGLEIARRLEEAGVDALHVDAGCYESWYRAIPPVYSPPAPQIGLAEEIRKVVKIPIIAHGKLGCPEIAEAVLQEGKVDFIGLGRSLLADPHWVFKVKEGLSSDIVPCIGCSEGCLLRGARREYASCAVNPACAMEREYEIFPTSDPKSVLVVGGGPAGLEAAIVAAGRGHKVTLWEKGSKLGGNLLPAAAPDFKRDVRRLVDYMTSQVEKLVVEIEVEKEATAENILEMAPDVVIVATGSQPVVPDLPGIDRNNVFTAIETLNSERPIGERVVIAGGGVLGCETGLFLAQRGKSVTIVEADGLLTTEPVFVLNYLNLMRLLGEHDLEILERTKLVEVDDQGVVVEAREKREHIDCDSVVVALGLEEDCWLEEELEEKVKDIFIVGDAAQPRKVLNAVWEGFHAARMI